MRSGSTGGGRPSSVMVQGVGSTAAGVLERLYVDVIRCPSVASARGSAGSTARSGQTARQIAAESGVCARIVLAWPMAGPFRV